MTKISEDHWKSDQSPSMQKPLKCKVRLYLKIKRKIKKRIWTGFPQVISISNCNYTEKLAVRQREISRPKLLKIFEFYQWKNPLHQNMKFCYTISHILKSNVTSCYICSHIKKCQIIQKKQRLSNLTADSNSAHHIFINIFTWRSFICIFANLVLYIKRIFYLFGKRLCQQPFGSSQDNMVPPTPEPWQDFQPQQQDKYFSVSSG